MARESNTTKWRKIRRMAWDRDRRSRAVCHICGEPIDYSLQNSTAPLSWEPDHIIPVSKNPALMYDLNNLAASHRTCNRRRGNGAFSNDIGMRSRIW